LLVLSADHWSFTLESATVNFRALKVRCLGRRRHLAENPRSAAVLGGDLRAAASPLRFVSMRDLQVKRLRSEDRWRQS
jgi:hypothetical protein